MRQCRQVDLADTAGHTRLILALQIQTAVEKHFHKLMNEGHMAGDEMRQIGRID